MHIFLHFAKNSLIIVIFSKFLPTFLFLFFLLIFCKNFEKMMIISVFLVKWGNVHYSGFLVVFLQYFRFLFFRLILGFHWLLCYRTMANDFFFENGNIFFFMGWHIKKCRTGEDGRPSKMQKFLHLWPPVICWFHYFSIKKKFGRKF